MKSEAIPQPVSSVDDVHYEGETTDIVNVLEMMEDLFSAPSTARLVQDMDSLCDSQGNKLLRIGEQV